MATSCGGRWSDRGEDGEHQQQNDGRCDAPVSGVAPMGNNIDGVHGAAHRIEKVAATAGASARWIV